MKVDVEDIRRLNVRPGEILVVRCREAATLAEWTAARDQLTKWGDEFLPDGVQIVVVRGIDFSVLSPVCAPAGDGGEPECVAAALTG